MGGAFFSFLFRSGGAAGIVIDDGSTLRDLVFYFLNKVIVKNSLLSLILTRFW